MLILILSIMLVFGGRVFAGTVHIPDPALEKAVRNALRAFDRDLTPEAMSRLRVLEAERAGILDLRGLEYAVNLRKLNLADNKVSDLSPLAGLVELEHLILRWNEITDIAPLAGLHGLVHLSLENNRISDIRPLRGLTSLRRLNLGVNGIVDITPLAGLNELEQLVLYYNRISDLSPLAGLTRLQVLNLSDNQIRELSPLLTNLNRGGLKGGFVNLSHNLLDTGEGSLARQHIRMLKDGGVSVNVGSQPGSVDYAIQAVEVRPPRGSSSRAGEESGLDVPPEAPQAVPETVQKNVFPGLLDALFWLILLAALFYAGKMAFSQRRQPGAWQR